MMERLQHLVDKARSRSLPSLQAAAPNDRDAAAPVPLSDTSANGGGQERAFRTAALAQGEPRTIPIPIKFAFREASFTEDGRKRPSCCWSTCCWKASIDHADRPRR